MTNLVNALDTIAAGVGTAFVIYIAATLRRYLRKHAGEHDFLMRQTKDNTELIRTNTDSIRKLVETVDRRDRRAEERVRRNRAKARSNAP